MAVTLEQLRTQVLRHANMVSGSFPVDELDSYINEAGSELWGTLVRLYEDHCTTPEWTTLVITGSAFQASLPADCLKLRGLESRDGGDWYPIPRVSPKERSRWQRASQASHLWAGSVGRRGYEQLAQTLSFVPEHDAAGEYRFRYVQAWTPLTASEQALPGVVQNGWWELIALGGAIRCLQSEQAPTAHLEERVERLVARVESEAAIRDVVEQEFLVDPGGDSWRWGR